MPGSGSLTLAGTIVGIPTGQQDVNVVWTLPNAVVDVFPITLLVGDNLITVPTDGAFQASTVLIIPPDGNTVVIALKTTTGDAGIHLHQQLPTYMSIDTSVPHLYLTVGSVLTGPVRVAFY